MIGLQQHNNNLYVELTRQKVLRTSISMFPFLTVACFGITEGVPVPIALQIWVPLLILLLVGDYM
jgi:hypothetical protein